MRFELQIEGLCSIHCAISSRLNAGPNGINVTSILHKEEPGSGFIPLFKLRPKDQSGEEPDPSSHASTSLVKQGSNESSKSKKPARSSGKSKPSKSTAVDSPRAEAGPSDIDDKADNSGNDKANDGEDRDSGEEPEGDDGNHTKDSESQSDDEDDELVDGEFLILRLI